MERAMERDIELVEREVARSIKGWELELVKEYEQEMESGQVMEIEWSHPSPSLISCSMA